MPTPVNNGTPGDLKLDYKVVHAQMLSVTKTETDLTGDASTQFTADITNQNTSKVQVNMEPSLELSASPADLGGEWGATGVTAGGEVEISVDEDDYVKIPVDQLGVKPGEAATKLGKAFGKALIKARNSHFVNEIATKGQVISLDSKFADLTADEIWNSLVETVTQYTESVIDPTAITLYISARSWNTLLLGRATLNVAVNPQEQAKTLLQVGKIRVINLPTDVVALAFHPSAVCSPAILDSLRVLALEINWYFARVKYDTDVLLPGACRVVKAAPAADGGAEAPAA